jgi:hypothetical protein
LAELFPLTAPRVVRVVRRDSQSGEFIFFGKVWLKLFGIDASALCFLGGSCFFGATGFYFCSNEWMFLSSVSLREHKRFSVFEM